jgi:hypothetical protein
MHQDFGPRKSRSVSAFLFHRFRWSRQGIAKHNLNTTEKQIFLVTLMTLAEHYGRLPDSMIITEKIEVEDKILASGGIMDVRCGKYKGHLVAVRTMKDPAKKPLKYPREVSINKVLDRLGRCLDHPSPAILQRSRSLEHTISSEHLEVCWGSGGHGKGAIRHRVRVDGPWGYHGVHPKESRQQTGTGT